MGGGEVSALAARHPGRVAKVVYLDGAYDWADRPTSDISVPALAIYAVGDHWRGAEATVAGRPS